MDNKLIGFYKTKDVSLKKIIVALLCVAVWGVSSENITYTEGTFHIKSIETKLSLPNIDWFEPDFTCDGRQYCSEMASYEETKFFLEHCPDTKLDIDNDGLPCENGEW